MASGSPRPPEIRRRIFYFLLIGDWEIGIVKQMNKKRFSPPPARPNQISAFTPTRRSPRAALTQCMRALRRAGSKACWQGTIVWLCFVVSLVCPFFNVCRLSLSKFSNLSFHFVVSLCRFVVVLSFRRSLCRVVVLPMHCTTSRRTI